MARSPKNAGTQDIIYQHTMSPSHLTTCAKKGKTKRANENTPLSIQPHKKGQKKKCVSQMQPYEINDTL